MDLPADRPELPIALAGLGGRRPRSARECAGGHPAAPRPASRGRAGSTLAQAVPGPSSTRSSCHAAGQPADGEAPAREALRIRQQALGRNHPAAAADGAALAGILIAMDRDEEAAQLLDDVLEAFVRCLGPKHLAVGITLGSIGAIAARRGQRDRAEVCLRQALEIKEHWLGAHHLELVPTLGPLGVICRRQGDHAGAASLYRRGLALLDKRVTCDHPAVASRQANPKLEEDHALRERAPRRAAQRPGRVAGRHG